MSETSREYAVPQVNEELVDNVEVIRRTDPRDYFSFFRLVKEGRAAAPELPWNKVDDRIGNVASDNEHALLIAGRTSREDGDDNVSYGLLVVSCDKDQEIEDNYEITGLTSGKAELIAKTLYAGAVKLPNDKRTALARFIGRSKDTLQVQSPDEAAEFCARVLLESLPDISSRAQFDSKLLDFSKATNKPSEIQRKQLESLFSVISRKTDQKQFDELVDDLTDNKAKFTDGIFERNFRFYLFDTAVDVSDKRLEIWADYKSLQKYRVLRFPIEQLVQRRVESVEQIKQILAEMPAEPIPLDILVRLNASKKDAEFVDVDKIVGGNYKGNFADHIRGTEWIYKIAQGFTSGKVDINDGEIDLAELDGKYYVNGDGHHRVSAVKALQVPFIPAVVTHFS